MAELKTQQNSDDVNAFVETIEDDSKRSDTRVVLNMMQEVTGEPPSMWGGSIVGFGKMHYKSKSGREGDWMKIGFSPRKSSLTLYFLDSYEFVDHKDLLDKLGKHKTSKGCLYINKLADVDVSVLRQVIERSVDRINNGHYLS